MPEPHSANSSVRTTALTASLFILLLAAYGPVSTRFKAMGDLSLYQAYAARAREPDAAASGVPAPLRRRRQMPGFLAT